MLKLCFAVLLGVLAWQAIKSPFWLYKAPRFTVRSEGLIQDAQLQPFATLVKGEPIYKINTGKLAKRVKQRYSIVQYVSVRRHIFPHRLEFTVVEKRPWAEIYINEKQTRPYALLTTNGIVDLKDYSYRPGMYQKPRLEKILLPPRTKVSADFLDRLQQITWQAHQVKALHLKHVDARQQDRVVLHYQEVPVILGRLNNSASERLARLYTLIPKINEFKDAINSVDLFWEEQVTFHKKANAKIVLKDETEEGH